MGLPWFTIGATFVSLVATYINRSSQVPRPLFFMFFPRALGEKVVASNHQRLSVQRPAGKGFHHDLRTLNLQLQRQNLSGAIFESKPHRAHGFKWGVDQSNLYINL